MVLPELQNNKIQKNHFFRRKDTWILHSGNDKLSDLQSKQLQNQYVCSEHFRPSDYRSKKLLSDTAIPKMYSLYSSYDRIQIDLPPPTENLRVSTLIAENVISGIDSKFYGTSHTPNDFVDNSSKNCCDFSVKIIQDLHQKISSLKNSLKKATKQVRSLKRDKKNFQEKLNNFKESQHFFESYHKLNQNVKDFVDMQLRHVKHCAWTEKEKDFCLEFYYRSAKGYIHLRNYRQFSLACTTLISQWVNQLALRPGICPTLCELLKVRVRSMSAMELDCVLIWDGLSIKTWLEYNKHLDLIEGFEDLGSLGRYPNAATEGLVFMLRGRRSQWKQVFSYYVSKNSLEGKHFYSSIYIFDFKAKFEINLFHILQVNI